MRRIFGFVLVLACLGLPAVRADILWNSGSHLPSTIPALSIGWNQTVPSPGRFALAGNFELTQPSDLTALTVFGFATGNTPALHRVQAAYVRILADADGAPGPVIWGDWEHPLDVTETATGDYNGSNISRPIFRIQIDLPGVRLCPGRYFVQYNVDQIDTVPDGGAANGNYLSTLVVPAPANANGYHYIVTTNQYFSLRNPAWPFNGNVPPFILEGVSYAACLAAGGDQDGDGFCTAADVPLFVTRLLSDTFQGCADANGDCVADGRDVQAFVNCVGS